MSQGLLAAGKLQELLETRTIGRRVEVHVEVDSTNTVTLERADVLTNHGLVIFAERQKSGRGRMGKSWHAPKGAAVMCSVLLFLETRSPVAERILLWSALAVRDAILHSANVDAIIKWPNDLLVRDRKICGILIESRPICRQRRAYVIGIGINCLQHRDHFPPEIRESATSLDLESDGPIERLDVATRLLTELDRWYEESANMTASELTARWSAHAMPMGKRLQVRSDGRAFCGSLIALDPNGGILLELDGGVRRMFSPYTTTIEDMAAPS